MTNREMMEIAMRQSAEDMGCRVEDLKADKNVVVPINLGKKARKYLKEPITCNLVSYGNNIMAASIPETMDLVSAYVDKFEFYHCFETPNMHWLNERLVEKRSQNMFHGRILSAGHQPDTDSFLCLCDTSINTGSFCGFVSTGMGQCALRRSEESGCTWRRRI